MGFGGGGFFGSGADSSKNDNSTKALESAQTSGNGGLSLGLQDLNINLKKADNSSVNFIYDISSTDYGAIDDAFSFAANRSREMEGIAGDAIYGAAESLGMALDYGGDVSDMAFKFGGDVVYESLSVVDSANDRAFDIVADSFDFVDSTNDNAFGFALDLSDQAFEMGNSAIAANSDLTYAILQSQDATFGATLDAIEDNNAMSDQLILQSLDYNQALIGEGNRSEGATISALLVEKIVPLALLAGGLLLLRK